MNKTTNIVILEDNIDEFRLIKRQLERSELKCSVNHTFILDEFENLLDEGMPDIIISDYNLKTFTAEDALELLRSRSKIVPFILISGAIGEEKAVELMRNGVNDFLMKDKLQKLIPVIQRELKEYKTRKENEEYRIKLEESNKQLENFAYIVSHDLKEPLRMVKSFAELLEKNCSDSVDKQSKVYLKFITDGAKKMDTLIQSILDFSRITTQGNEFEEIDLNDVVKSNKQVFSDDLENLNASIEYSELPVILGDAVQVTQLFQNLIGNALKFINVGVAPKIEISAEESESEWIFSIKDNGIGIDEKHKEKIFQIFQKLHSFEKFEGTGIGLAFCKQIVKRHGGRIWVESEPGQGSTFVFAIKKNI